MQTKLREILTFPCFFTYKIIGLAQPRLVEKIISVIQIQIPGDYTPKVKSSNKGNYLSVSIRIFVKNFEQIETLYKEISKINIVKIVF